MFRQSLFGFKLSFEDPVVKLILCVVNVNFNFKVLDLFLNFNERVELFERSNESFAINAVNEQTKSFLYYVTFLFWKLANKTYT